MADQIAEGIVKLGKNFTSHRIIGHVPHAYARGLDPKLDVPLISRVWDNFYQGGCMHGVQLPEEFDYVLSLYKWEQYKLGPNTERDEVTMYDSLDQGFDQVHELADKVADKLIDGKSVLVHCQAGLNRSGLLAALTITKMTEMSGKEAVALLRKQRSPLVLCNEAFENYVNKIPAL